MSSSMRDIGAYITSRYGIAITSVTAAGTGDATEVDGETVDRFALGGRNQSAKMIVAVQATLTSDKTITIEGNFQDSTNDSDWVDHGAALAAATVCTGQTGGTEEEGVIELDVDLSSANRYVRIQVTPDMSHTGTDTALVAGVIVFGGADALPAS